MALSHYAQMGTDYDEVYLVTGNLSRLKEARNIFVDPDFIGDYEIGQNFLVGGGIPLEAISRVTHLKRVPLFIKGGRYSESLR